MVEPKKHHVGGVDNPEDPLHFSKTRWLHQMSYLAARPERLDVDAWTTFMHETTLLFKCMGNAMSVAFSGKISLALMTAAL